MQVLISVMLRYIHETFNLGPLIKIDISIQLVDCSIVYYVSVIEYVLVQVRGSIFLIDFYIIDMEDDKYLIHRPFS